MYILCKYYVNAPKDPDIKYIACNIMPVSKMVRFLRTRKYDLLKRIAFLTMVVTFTIKVQSLDGNYSVSMLDSWKFSYRLPTNEGWVKHARRQS